MTRASDWQTSGPTPARGPDDAGRARVERLRTIYYWLHLIADFAAAALFVVGSGLFFYPSLSDTATWMFLIGSICFAWKPTLRLISRLHEARLVRALEQKAAALL